jgi:hypothetical protein
MLKRIISGLLFVLSTLAAPMQDLVDNVLPELTQIKLYAPSLPERAIAHFTFHSVTSVVALVLVALVLSISLLVGPYRKGERWAWWALALPGLLVALVKILGTLTIYAHGIFGGLTVELELPLLIWILAVALSWREYSPIRKAA